MLLLRHKGRFKYISCYCLSDPRHYGSRQRDDSNTSHVIVYPRSHGIPFRSLRYSNTSHVIVYRFIPISTPCSTPIQIHLMLLFIPYPPLINFGIVYSNTSHVIVYPTDASLLPFWKEIQIHLMLLFIRAAGACGNPQRAFKYISCYCLSCPPVLW